MSAKMRIELLSVELQLCVTNSYSRRQRSPGFSHPDEVIRVGPGRLRDSVELLQMLRRKLDRRRCEVVLELIDGARTENHRAHLPPCEQPGQSDAWRSGFELASNRAHCIDDLPGALVVVFGVAVLPGLQARTGGRCLVLRVLSREQPATERAPHHHPKLEG